MIDFYSLTSPNVQKIYIMLEETKLPYKEHFVDVWKGDQFEPDFLRINPNANSGDRRPGRARRQAVHSVRVRRDLDVFGRKNRKVPNKGHGKEIRRAAVVDVSGFGRRSDVRAVYPLQNVRAEGQGQFLFDRALPDRSEAALRGSRETPRQPALSRRKEYTIADMATFPWTRNHDMQGVKWEDSPNVARWFNAISERPAVKTAIARVGAIKSNRETASEEQKDRFFNRGRYARA